MSDELRKEIEFGIENLEKVRASIAIIHAYEVPAAVKDPALAYECLGYYNALEHLMLRFLKHQGTPKPAGAASHRDALRQFARLCEEIQIPLNEEVFAIMTELMGFRHVATKIYGFLIDHERLNDLVIIINEKHLVLRQVIEQVLGKIEPQ